MWGFGGCFLGYALEGYVEVLFIFTSAKWGPLPVISGVIAPFTHVQGHLWGLFHPTYADRRGPPSTFRVENEDPPPVFFGDVCCKGTWVSCKILLLWYVVSQTLTSTLPETDTKSPWKSKVGRWFISLWESLFLRANSWFQGMSPIQPGFKPSAAPSDLSGPAKVSLWPFNAVHRWMKRFWISQGFLAITDEKCSCRRFLLGRGSPMKPYSGPVMRSNSFGIFTSYWRSSLPFHPKVGVEFMSPEKKKHLPKFTIGSPAGSSDRFTIGSLGIVGIFHLTKSTYNLLIQGWKDPSIDPK